MVPTIGQFTGVEVAIVEDLSFGLGDGAWSCCS